MSLSIIIPLAPGDSVERLLKRLDLCGYNPIVTSDGSRAKSLNHGGRIADGKYLLFLHADSFLDESFMMALPKISDGDIDTLYYFKLRFDKVGLVSLNAILTNFRCRLFNLPYGDQGFFISKRLFIESGGFREDVPYGEDMYFVLKLKSLGKSIKNIPIFLTTSSRKYDQKGWLRLTLEYQWKFWRILFVSKFTKDKKL